MPALTRSHHLRGRPRRNGDGQEKKSRHWCEAIKKCCGPNGDDHALDAVWAMRTWWPSPRLVGSRAIILFELLLCQLVRLSLEGSLAALRARDRPADKGQIELETLDDRVVGRLAHAHRKSTGDEICGIPQISPQISQDLNHLVRGAPSSKTLCVIAPTPLPRAMAASRVRETATAYPADE